MTGSREADRPPSPNEFSTVFDVYEVRRDGDTILYLGEPLANGDDLERELWQTFDARGYEIRLQQGYRGSDDLRLSRGEYVLVASPSSTGSGFPRTNVILFFLTVASTLLAGSVFWYQIPLLEEPWRMLEAWPFVVAIMGVLGVHELGHYVMSRYHGVDATLPYFIPVPTVIGSLGAVIRIKGRIPDRKALFDIGVAGPLAGLAATFVVTAVGLHLDPLAVQEPAGAAASSEEPVVLFNHPPLLELIATLVGASDQLENGVVHPVVFGGWVGMLVTLLNMLPVGQLDGGHIIRAMFGDRQRYIATLVPGALFALALYVFVTSGWQSMTIWIMWGIFAIGLAYGGPARPIDDSALDRKRIALGIVTFVLAALCFTPIPVEIVEAAELAG
ncbi:site-2 protease family protein [Halovenus salina]|uniref:Site-2 protease family protein n=1 Tax=Halovenus salina TaxID=1510225 RepID=A0ABD5W3X0_9EURY|nr:site-2 protease family protein [Halovenus salina]